MIPSEILTATKLRLFAALLAWSASLTMMASGSAVLASPVVGTVIDVSGPILARKADGTARSLSLKSGLEQGDTLVSEGSTYARIQFVDNSEAIVGPSTQLKIDAFSFNEAKPENDIAKFDLVKGSLRLVSGALIKRNKKRASVTTPTGTIGMESATTFIAQYVQPKDAAKVALEQSRVDYLFASVAALDRTNEGPFSDAPSVLADIIAPLYLAQNNRPGGGGLAPGLYVHVIDGLIQLSNRGGTQNFAAGQFGFTGSLVQPPVIVPNNPGIQFNPPPAFQSNTSNSSSNTSQGTTQQTRPKIGTPGPGNTGGAGGGKPSGS